MMLDIIIIALCVIYTKGQFRYDYTYDARSNGWFKLHPVPASWPAARVQCYYEGAILASPLNKDFWKAIVDVIQTDNTNPEFVFSGVHSNIVEGIYTTVDGKPIEELDILWAPNEPRYAEGHGCLVYGNNGTMSNKKCEDHYPYICYKEWTETTISSRCGTIDHEYEFREETGSCYKFHRVGKMWLEAFAICQAERGHLAIIDHVNETKVLTDIFAKYPRNKIIFSPYPDSASIGFLNQNGWWTIHGVSLEDEKYMIWSSGSPNNVKLPGAGDQTCGGIYRTGLLDDIWCTVNLPFICEMPMNNNIYLHKENIY